MSFKKLFVVSLTVFTAMVIMGCGKDKGKTVDGTNVTNEKSADVDKFMKDYEEFVNGYCSVAEQISKASMMKKVKLMRGLAEKSTKLNKYANDSIALKASMSADAQKKLAELENKASECSKKIKM